MHIFNIYLLDFVKLKQVSVDDCQTFIKSSLSQIIFKEGSWVRVPSIGRLSGKLSGQQSGKQG